MVNRNHPDKTRNSDLTREFRSAQLRNASSKAVVLDDIITSLANAHENRRARQVTEWQSVAARTFRAAA